MKKKLIEYVTHFSDNDIDMGAGIICNGSFNYRFTEHKQSSNLTDSDNKSAVALHCKQENHDKNKI